MLSVVDIFETVQGEGMMTGWPAVFVRFSGCNMWTGHEAGRATATGVCGAFCDTDFVSNRKKYSASDLAAQVERLADRWHRRCVIVLTGGEPMMQLAKGDGPDFIRMLAGHYAGGVWIETNGSVAIPPNAMSAFAAVRITVSPKAVALLPASIDNIKIRTGEELKLLYPNAYNVRDVATLARSFNSVSVQMVDGSGRSAAEAIEYIRELSKYMKRPVRLGAQTHKYLGLK